ncbi:LytR/AlgR family response regulator transcription factor [Pseudoalteromonas sp. T1lg23B]|uniref:LytR/AlgR family response regulator transcription factor n=1 Tax=Pseudoalteromonas sp. T1lg23B TaxID=2077097 RepID=UPI000CF65A4F|nr:LytTR family DNA-binding domain-containing protein [Pseudoalteromonas sp. T1lg23B]
MKYLVVDDEPLARQRIIRLLSSLSDYECCAQTGRAQEVISLVEHHQPQVVLLDISMPDMDGLEVAKLLSELVNPPKVIFISAHPEYALEAFGVFASGYLVKPVQQSELHTLLRHLFPPRIKYSVGNHIRWLEVSEVLVARADDKYTQLIFTDAEAVVDMSLKQLLALYPEHFVQVHRNTLVKRSQMQSLSYESGCYYVRVNGYSETIPVSRRAAQALKSGQ